MKGRIEILASGFGGQGVVRLGQIIGTTAVRQGLHVTMLKSHGTETRGGYVRSQVVLSEDVVDSPMCESPDYFIALSKAAYDRFRTMVPERGIILYDPASVEVIDPSLPCSQRPVPAKALSEEHGGSTLFVNTLFLGVMAKLVPELDADLMLECLLEVVPRFHERNRVVFKVGHDWVQESA